MLVVQSKTSGTGGQIHPAVLYRWKTESSCSRQGLLHSRVFPGLPRPVEPLLACDMAEVLDAWTEDEPLNEKPPETNVENEVPFA